MSKFDSFENAEIIPRAEKKTNKKSKKFYVRFTISNNFIEFSPDLWDECFEGMESMRLLKSKQGNNGNEVDWLYIKGYKIKVTSKNDKDLHEVKLRKGTGRRYLNLKKEEFDSINDLLNNRKGGVKSRAYGSSLGDDKKSPKYPEENKSPAENVIIIDHKDRQNWRNSSIERKDKKGKSEEKNSK